MLKRLFISLLLLSYLAGYSQSNKYRFHRYGQQEGLTSRYINTIAEDAFGFVWIGSDDGLFRFDGNDYIDYSTNKENGLISNSITAILPIDNGDMWIGTREGLQYFDVKTEKFTNVWPDLQSTYISKIVPDEKGNLWIGSRDGLYYYERSTDNYKRYLPNDGASSISDKGIFDLMYDSQGRFWISTSKGGLNLYQPDTDDFKSFRHDPLESNTISSDALRKLAESPDGKILIGTYSSGLNVLNPENGIFKHYNHEPDNPNSLSTYSIFSLLVDDRENIWVGTWANGLNKFDIESEKANRYNYNPDSKFSVPHNSIKCLMQSSTGDIWIGTNGGLARFSYREQEIIRFEHHTNDQNSLLTSHIRSVYEDSDGIIWIGAAQEGLHKFDPKTNLFKVYLKSDGTRNGKARGTVWSISPSADNHHLWLGTSRGVAKFNKDTEQIIFYEPDENDSSSLSTNDVLKVLDDHDGNIWAGTWSGGLNRMDITDKSFEQYSHIEGDSTSILSDNIGEIFKDSDGRVWVASTAGMSMLNPDGRTFTDFDIHAQMIVEDKGGYLWFATTNGLVKFDPEEKIITETITVDNGLPSNEISAVSIDDKDRIWVGSQQGLAVYDPFDGSITVLSIADGLSSNIIDVRAMYFSDKSKNLLIGGSRGMSQIDTRKPLDDDVINSVFLTNLLLFNKQVEVSDSTRLNQSLHTAKEVILDYTDYIFAFEFTALNYSQPQKIEYGYKLEGFDEEWIYTNYNDRKAVYTQVPPGDYVFKVKASDTQGIWQDDQMTSIMVKIVPPWWRTWWAKILFYIGIMALILIIFKVRISAIERQKVLLEQQVQERSSPVLLQKQELEYQAAQLNEINNQKNKLFSIISHDLRSPLNSLTGIMSLLDPNILTKDDLANMKSHISERIDHISSVMENLLSWSKSQLEGEVLNSKLFSVSQIINSKINLFNPIAIKKQIKLVSIANTEIKVYADINQTKAVLRNLINNAIKFTKVGGTISVDVRKKDNMAIISVKDSGVGMSLSQQEKLFEVQSGLSTEGTAGEKGVGLGLLLVKEFVEKNNGRVWIESEEGVGSTFYFTLALSDEI
jgi:ligand-binding sensor domain-containing protein/signal transduction histidine kinase